ncbi:MAG: transcriptional repressor LexA, partial [Clostridiales bacterium]|nr:transcriptional repressor LexA [Clostridiales bacterium]
MGYGKISEKQQQILDYIKEQILNKGYPPSVRDICSAVDLRSTSSVHSHLEKLEKNGYIRRDPSKSRTIEIIDDDFNDVRREMSYVPEIGEVAAGVTLLAVQSTNGYFPIHTEYL